MTPNLLDPKGDLTDPRVRAQLNDTLEMLCRLAVAGARGEAGADGAPGADGAAGADANRVSPYARRSNSGTQTVGTGASATVLVTTTEEMDTEVYADDTNGIAVLVTGRYLALANIWWTANATGVRALVISHRDSTFAVVRAQDTVVANAVVGGDDHLDQMSAVFTVETVGDVIGFLGRQNTGGDLNLSSAGRNALTVVRLGDLP